VTDPATGEDADALEFPRGESNPNQDTVGRAFLVATDPIHVRVNLGHFEGAGSEGYDPDVNSLYVPAIKVHGGSLVFVSGVTAAPVYHDPPPAGGLKRRSGAGRLEAAARTGRTDVESPASPLG
jgi:hypothetical protein